MNYLIITLVFIVGFATAWLTTRMVEVPADVPTDVPTDVQTTPSQRETDSEPVGRETSDTQTNSDSLGLTAKVVVYDGISVPTNTKTLDLSGRGLSGSLKAEVRQLSGLEELDLSNNNFTGLPAEVGQLSELRILNLSNNPFTGLPYELGNLQNLEVLDVRGTNYAKADLEVIRDKLPTTTSILTE